MSEDNKWYVYMHTNKINKKKYIGITGQKNYLRRWGTEGNGYRTQIFGKAIKKYGWDNFSHKILEVVDTQEQALERERYYIQKFKSNNKDYGYNISPGGQTISGLYNLPSMSVPVYQYDLDGNFLEMYPSIMEAERATGIENSAICACCKGKHHYTKQYIWSYEKFEKIPHINPKQLRYELITKKQEKKVYQYDLDGNYIAEYKSTLEADRLTGVSFKHISSCCLGKRRQTGGYRWSYVYYNNLPKMKAHANAKKVNQYNKNGDFIQSFDSLSEASSCLGISASRISACCTGKMDTYKGYIWKYIS